jgi:hypothetical protein
MSLVFRFEAWKRVSGVTAARPRFPSTDKAD